MAQWVKDLVVTVAAQVVAVAPVQSLAWELPHVLGMAKKKKKMLPPNKSEVTSEVLGVRTSAYDPLFSPHALLSPQPPSPLPW